MTVSWASCRSPQYIPIFCTDADVVYASPMDNLKGKNIRFEHVPYPRLVLTTHVTPTASQTIPKSIFLWNEIWDALNGTPSFKHCFLKVDFEIVGSAPTYPATLTVKVNYYDPFNNYSWSDELFSTQLTGPKKKVELYSAWGYMRGTKYFDLSLYIRYGTGITISVSSGSWDVTIKTYYSTLLSYGLVQSWIFRDTIFKSPGNELTGIINYPDLISKSVPKITFYIEGYTEDDPVEEEFCLEFFTPISVDVVKQLKTKVHKSFNFTIEVPSCADPSFGISEPILVPSVALSLGEGACTMRWPRLSGTWVVNGYYVVDFGYPE
jgi:hypothetical protein